MRNSDQLSRRDMMKLAGAAGGLAVTGAHVFAQGAKKIEQMAPELANIISTSEPIRELASGFGGDIGPAEGPLWMAEGKYLLFSDIQRARRMKYVPGQQGATVAQEKSNEANGSTRDQQGRILVAEHLTRRVTRYEPDGSITVVANSFQGKRLLRPNDVIVKSDGTIYFTDPGGPLAQEQWDVVQHGVYRVSADLGSISMIIPDMIGPNGIAFSPDEKILYVGDARRRHIRAFDMLPNGMVSLETSRVFADLGGPEPGVPDGFKVDSAGNVYSGGGGGLYIIDPKGKKLGRIVHGHNATTNVAFGGDDWKTLYFTSRSTLFSVNIKVPGLPVPAKKRSA